METERPVSCMRCASGSVERGCSADTAALGLSSRVAARTTMAYWGIVIGEPLHASIFHPRAGCTRIAAGGTRRRSACLRAARPGARHPSRSRPRGRLRQEAIAGRRDADARLEGSQGAAVGARYARPQHQAHQRHRCGRKTEHAEIRTGAARQGSRQQTDHRRAPASGPGAHRLRDVAAGLRTAMADTGTDRGQETAVHVLAVRIDPRAFVGAAAGFTRDPFHLRRAHQRAERYSRRDERNQRCEARAGRRLPLRPAQADSVVPAGDRRGRHRCARNRSAQRGLCRTVCGR